jgi:hypothetical protein
MSDLLRRLEGAEHVDIHGVGRRAALIVVIVEEPVSSSSNGVGEMATEFFYVVLDTVRGEA